MGRRIGNTTVHVHDEDGATRVYGPGSLVPDEDAARITNPSVWADGDQVVEPAAGESTSGGGEVFVIVEDGKVLNENGRFVKDHGAAIRFASEAEADERLAELADKHPGASVEPTTEEG